MLYNFWILFKLTKSLLVLICSKLWLGLNRYSVRLLGSAEYLILGNTRYSVVTSLPSIKNFFLNNISFIWADIYESKLTYIEAQGHIYL